MSSACRLGILAALALCLPLRAGEPQPLRVCADPNNLPFSNDAQQGFENQIAALVARDLGRPLSYVWWPQRRGFIRRTLGADRCDLVIGVPAQSGRAEVTQAYYRSTYAFVSRRDRHLDVRSFDDPRLKSLTIGIQIIGADYANPPAAQALAARRLAANVRGYTVYGDYSQPDPQRDVIDAVADGRVDLAVVWGPVAGYYGRRAPTAIDVVPVSPERDGPSLMFAFDIAMGVRPGDRALREAVDRVIARRRTEMLRILMSFGVPVSR